jgi:hypothetical protein
MRHTLNSPSSGSTGNKQTGITSRTQQRRPTGITILTILEILTGLVFLLGGTALLAFAGGGSSILLIFGIIHLPIGFSFLIIGGLTILHAKRWVWTLGLTIVVISIVDDIVAFAVVPLPFDGVIGTAIVSVTALASLYLLARAEVRAFLLSPL